MVFIIVAVIRPALRRGVWQVIHAHASSRRNSGDGGSPTQTQ